MKNLRLPLLIFTLLLFLIPFQNKLMGQGFAPVGAKWVYTKDYSFSFAYSYLELDATKDTIILNEPCRVLETEWNCLVGEKQFIKSNQDSVWFYHKGLKVFQLLYCFNCQQGDSWNINFEDTTASYSDSINFYIDSIFTKNINGKNLRCYNHTIKTDGVNWQRQSTVCEYLGDLDYFFNFIKDPGLICDHIYPIDLRCYHDTTLGAYETGTADSCYERSTSVRETDKGNLTLKVFPNPSNEVFHLQNSSNSHLIVKVFNGLGQQIEEISIVGNEILRLTDLKPGIYFLKYHQKGENTTSDNTTLIRSH